MLTKKVGFCSFFAVFIKHTFFLGVISTVVLVHCPSERVAKLVGGVGDGKLRQINESLQHDLQDTFQNYVRVKVVLKVPKQ